MRRAGQPDIRLLQAVAVVGKKKLNKWSTVAEMVGSRSQTQCRERYCNILDPDLKAGKRYCKNGITPNMTTVQNCVCLVGSNIRFNCSANQLMV